MCGPPECEERKVQRHTKMGTEFSQNPVWEFVAAADVCVWGGWGGGGGHRILLVSTFRSFTFSA